MAGQDREREWGTEKEGRKDAKTFFCFTFFWYKKVLDKGCELFISELVLNFVFIIE